MKSVKILHILKSVGGVEVVVRNITDHTDPKKIINIIAHDNTEKIYFDKNKKPLKAIKLPLFRELSIVNDYRCIKILLQVINEEKPHKIHCHSSKAGLIGRIVGYLSKTQVLYTPQALSYLSTQNKYKRQFYIFIERITKFQSTTTFLASSNSEKERGKNEINYSDNRCLLYNNTIPSIVVNKANSEKEKYMVTLSRPSYQKNVEMLIHAMKIIVEKHPNLKLKIVGAGYYSPNTKSVQFLISQFNLENNIEIIEWCEKEKAYEYIYHSEFVVSAARYEGLPLTIIEALALSKPCLVTNVDGNKDLVIDGFNGYVVPSEDYIKFAKQAELLLNDKELLKLFSKNSLNLYNDNFNVVNNISHLESIYIS